MDNKIKVAIADTNAEFNASTSEFLRQKGFDVCVTATDGYELLNAISEMKPDVVLLDTALPVIDGLKVMRETENLNLDQPPSFIVITSFANDGIMRSAAKSGAAHFIPKPFDPDMLCERICQCCDAITATYGLTPREHEIIVMLAHNRTVSDIAGDLIISVRTVNTHMNNIYRKLDIHSRNELSDLLRSTQGDVR